MSEKRRGYHIERRLMLLLQSWGHKCWRVKCSGALKYKGKKYAGDLKVIIANKVRTVEAKMRKDFQRFYNLVDGGKAVIINGFCVLLTRNGLRIFSMAKPASFESIPDSIFQQLHGFFEQDNADLVAMVSPYRQFIFAVSLNLYAELSNPENCGGINAG